MAGTWGCMQAGMWREDTTSHRDEWVEARKPRAAPTTTTTGTPIHLHALERLAVLVEVQLLGGVGAQGTGAGAANAAHGLRAERHACSWAEAEARDGRRWAAVAVWDGL